MLCIKVRIFSHFFLVVLSELSYLLLDYVDISLLLASSPTHVLPTIAHPPFKARTRDRRVQDICAESVRAHTISEAELGDEDLAPFSPFELILSLCS